MFIPGYMRYPSGVFEQSYKSLPVSFIDKSHLENGDKVIMPPSALDRLASLRIDYPMVFEIRNPATGNVSHCGVLEFTAEEGIIYMPYWMMQNLLLQVEDVVKLKSATLPKGTYVKLQPHTKDFLDISNPKAVLETTLRSFSCLTTGDNIMVAYNNKKYYIDIVETKPSDAISIIETDCEVDFAPPLDYVEPVKPEPPVSNSPQEQPQVVEAPETSVKVFTGTGRRLDGKPSNTIIKSPTFNGSPSIGMNPTYEKSESLNAKTVSKPSKPSGRLVFGSSSSVNGSDSTKKQEESETEKNPEKDDAPKFTAFTGKGYKLK